MMMLTPILAPIEVVMVLFGAAHGEDYGEGFICFVAIGLWPYLVLGISLVEYRCRRKARAGTCDYCGCNLAGLPSGGPCPECGKVPAPAAA